MNAPVPATERRDPPRRVPTALVLGLLAGVLATVAVLPTIVPLTQRVGRAEDQASLAQAWSGARAVSVLLREGIPPTPGLARRLRVDGVHIVARDGVSWYRDGEAPGLALQDLCPPGDVPTRIVHDATVRWAVACEDTGTDLVVSAELASPESSRTISFLVIGLAAMVGISTAFGVLQLLSPLSRIAEGLERVQLGERGVRVRGTGLTELDDLVEHLNGAARAMEDREDAIAGRIQLVQEMARMVAHEIRNPLQSLELLASLVAVEDDAGERQQIVQSIQQEVRALENVVGRMLRSNDGQALRLVRQPVSPAQLVERVVSFRRLEARQRSVRLAAAPDNTTEPVDVDVILVSRALENLVANALDFVPPQGGEVVVSATRSADRVTIEVLDNGPGVPTELGDTIYSIDVTGRPEQDGHGLGLALVSAVAGAHGGYVTHGRSEQGGAAFRLVVPTDPEGPPLAPAAPMAAEDLDDLPLATTDVDDDLNEPEEGDAHLGGR